MRKTTVLVLLLFVLVIGAVGAKDFTLKGTRIGLEFGNPAAVIVFRPSNFDFKLGYNFIEGSEFVFLSGDYRIISGYHLIDFLHMFLGVGAYTKFYMSEGDRSDDDSGQFDLGARIPIGLQAFLIGNTLEFFLEIAPTVRFFPAIEAFKDFQGWIGFTILIK